MTVEQAQITWARELSDDQKEEIADTINHAWAENETSILQTLTPNDYSLEEAKDFLESKELNVSNQNGRGECSPPRRT